MEGESFFNKSNQLQRKLNIGHSSDPKEAEAENAAQKVVSQQQVQKAGAKEEEPVQKAAEKEEDKSVQKAEKQEEEKPVQKAESKEEEKPQAKLDPQLQTASKTEDGDGSNHAQPSFENLLAQRKGGGFPLPDDVRTEMERKFGANFRKVRIHHDPEASAMCEAINAYAFAHGYDIYFQEGLYNPTSTDGKALLAHELAHVVQQNG